MSELKRQESLLDEATVLEYLARYPEFFQRHGRRLQTVGDFLELLFLALDDFVGDGDSQLLHVDFRRGLPIQFVHGLLHFDPIRLWRKRLVGEGIITEEQLDAIDKEAAAEAQAAVKFAEDSPAPAVSEIMDDVYWETDNGTPASKLGWHFFTD